MAITTQDLLVAAMAAGQSVSIDKTVSRVAVAAAWTSLFDLAGNPGAGVLAGSSTAAGVVPTDATAGCPVINAFTGANTGYLAGVEFGNTVAGRLRISDMLFKAGAYAFNAAVTLAAQPSYASRGGDYKNTEIWLEAVTAFTGVQSIAVTYTNQDAVAGRTTGTIATGVAPIIGRMLQLNLQAGDTGVSKIESVTSTVATVGTFNVLVLRPLWQGRVRFANDGDVHGIERLGLLPPVFADSALFAHIAPDSTATGIPEFVAKVVNG